MENKLKTDKKLLSGLNSQNVDVVKDAIKEIKTSTNSEYLPFVINSLLEAKSESIRELLAEYIYDLKLESVKDHLITAINDPNNKSILSILVSSCWQNGISFKNHFELFTYLYINEDLIVAIEAYSVIENLLEDITLNEKDIIIKKLQKSIPEMDETKKSFTISLVDVITNS